MFLLVLLKGGTGYVNPTTEGVIETGTGTLIKLGYSVIVYTVFVFELFSDV